jgi:hypothetical protein
VPQDEKSVSVSDDFIGADDKITLSIRREAPFHASELDFLGEREFNNRVQHTYGTRAL